MTLPVVLATAGVACKSREEGSAFTVLTVSEASDFEAIAAQIIPSGDTPGATEAGVIYFIDAALADFRSEALEPMRLGLEELRAEILNTFQAESFASLDHDEQIAVLKGIENTSFFGTIRFLTVAGMFSNPSYGGNRDEVGWKLIGFEGAHPWQPPFGYYDAEYAEKGA